MRRNWADLKLFLGINEQKFLHRKMSGDVRADTRADVGRKGQSDLIGGGF